MCISKFWRETVFNIIAMFDKFPFELAVLQNIFHDVFHGYFTILPVFLYLK